MYLEHFGLREAPFVMTPDTGYFYNEGGHREAFNVLMFAIRSGEGFIKITGEVGTGKTLLCRQVLNALPFAQYHTAYIPNPCLTPAGLRLALAEELGVRCARNAGQHYLLQLIGARLVALHAEGRQVVLLLDEAQALPDDSLEALRLLTNLETEKCKLLQVVLFGQPELDARLQQRHLRQLRQRISFSHDLPALDRARVGGYVTHRLGVAGYTGAPLFTRAALRAIYRASGGVPRMINVLCHKTLLLAYGSGARQVVRTHVCVAAHDTDAMRHAPRRLLQGAALCAAVIAALAYGLMLHGAVLP